MFEAHSPRADMSAVELDEVLMVRSRVNMLLAEREKAR
jgi:hypothetical protein